MRTHDLAVRHKTCCHVSEFMDVQKKHIFHFSPQQDNKELIVASSITGVKDVWFSK
jgi:hypothetical protein